jgi:predicted nucleic acid-binding protein
VLVHALDERDPPKQVAAWSWRRELCRTGRGRISFQVLQECYVRLLGIWPDRRAEAQAAVRDLLACKPAAVNVAIVELSWKLQHRYQLSFCNALLLSAAKATGSGYLLLEDLQSGQELPGVKVLNPSLTEALRSADGDSRVASDVCAKLRVPQMPSGATTP